MGRKYIYYCDQCDKEFGTHTHLNVKNLAIHKSIASTFDRWKSTRLNGIKDMYEELHFCNKTCFKSYITKLDLDILT